MSERVSILLSEEEVAKEYSDINVSDTDKPIVLVINDSKEKLKDIKESIGDKYKGVFVRDEESAEKYLSKHQVDYIIREGNINGKE